MGFEQFGKAISEVAKSTGEVAKNTSKDIDKRIDVGKIKEHSLGSEKNNDIDKKIEVSKKKIEIDKVKEYNDRIKQAESSDGEWSGKVGESTLTLKTGEKVEYKDGYPNFTPYSKGDVKINNMTSDKDTNWAYAKKAYAEKWNKECKDGKSNWTDNDVAKYKKDNDLVFHECEDMKTCQLVPKHIHRAAQHYGGRHECKIRGK